MAAQANKPSVLVMMAAYNGERYVAEQIESILAQEDVAVTLQISDDGSTDHTCSICEEYAARFENVLFKQNAANKGLAKNFMDMVYEADPSAYDYFAFSDQDDYWLSEKLAKAIDALHTLNDQHGPQLYYSDVLNVDATLRGPKPEYYPFKSIANQLKPLLTCNYASGCTMVFNGEMVRVLQSKPLNDFPRIHDVWVHLVALCCGEVFPDLEHSYICRRISGENQVGERDFGEVSRSRISGMLSNMLSGPNNEEPIFREAAQQLLDCYGGAVTALDRRAIEDFVKAHSCFGIRLKQLFDPGYRMPSAIDTLALKMRLLLGFY